MFEPFDIFRIKDGQPLWIKSAPALAAAQSQVDRLGAIQPGEYMIFCHHTRERISVRAAYTSVTKADSRAVNIEKWGSYLQSKDGPREAPDSISGSLAIR
jgi:hypothetical protein